MNSRLFSNRSALAESAVSLIQLTAIEYETTLNPLIGFGRILRYSNALGTYDVENARLQAYYLRIIAIVEAYIDATIAGLLYSQLNDPDRVVRTLADRYLVDALQTWHTRLESLENLYGISISHAQSGFSEWPQFLGAIEVRNAIAHGLGKLTRKQQKSLRKTQAKIHQAGVHVDGGTVVLTQSNLMTLKARSVRLVEWLDERI